MSDPVTSPKQYFDTLGARFQKDAAKGVRAVFQFELSGEGGGTYHISVEDGTFAVHETAHPAPTVTLRMKAEDYVNLVNGKLTGQMAFATGNMKIDGTFAVHETAHPAPTAPKPPSAPTGSG